MDRKGRFLFEDRIWADTGIVHLGFDIRGMKPLGKALDKEGFGFRCDSNEALNMGDHTRVHCTYIDDPDEAWIEMIEVHKIPILEKLGLFLDVQKRPPASPCPNGCCTPCDSTASRTESRAIQLSDTFDGCCIDMKFHAAFQLGSNWHSPSWPLASCQPHGSGLRDGHHRGVDRQLPWRNRLGVDRDRQGPTSTRSPTTGAKWAVVHLQLLP